VSRCRFGGINISPANFTSMKKNPAEPTSTHTYYSAGSSNKIMTGKNRYRQPADWNGIIN
jgi:hypothetical protein